MRMIRFPHAVVLTACLLVPGCSLFTSKTKKATAAASPTIDQRQRAEADRNDLSRPRCDRQGRTEVPIDVNRDGRPDVWKLMAETVDQGTKLQVIACKEVDLNFDGRLDMWIHYDERGDIFREEFDLDFDGHIDLWTFRQQGKLLRQELDTNFDGRPDIWKYYEGEKLVRIERSSQRNGKVDVWEYYEGGRLDRIGYDTTGSGQVDKWDHAPPESATAAPPTP